MTQSFKDEFETVEILVNSNTKTGRTDAFIITFTKLEKQVRRIFTYLIYQFPSFSLNDYKKILEIIASKRYLYFANFIKGFDAIYPKSFESIIGSACYAQFLNTDFPRIQTYRNKILHGQPTGKYFSADDIKDEINIMRNWCSSVAESMMSEIGYDGLKWNSFRKNASKDLATTYKINIFDILALDAFIETNMR
jgi:hypothetical protein